MEPCNPTAPRPWRVVAAQSTHRKYFFVLDRFLYSTYNSPKQSERSIRYLKIPRTLNKVLCANKVHALGKVLRPTVFEVCHTREENKKIRERERELLHRQALPPQRQIHSVQHACTGF